MKQCPICGETDLTKFGVDNSKPDKLKIQCRKCICEKAKVSREKNKKTISAQRKRYREEFKNDRKAPKYEFDDSDDGGRFGINKAEWNRKMDRYLANRKKELDAEVIHYGHETSVAIGKACGYLAPKAIQQREFLLMDY